MKKLVIFVETAAKSAANQYSFQPAYFAFLAIVYVTSGANHTSIYFTFERRRPADSYNATIALSSDSSSYIFRKSIPNVEETEVSFDNNYALSDN